MVVKHDRNINTSIARFVAINAVTKGLVSKSRSPNKFMRFV
jgi:hypothetical protein